jgi:hypothetical protein
MCQELEILMALKRGEKITPLFALNEFKCFRLSARIENLRKQGYSIRTEMIETESGKRVAEYSMEIK